MLKFKVVLVNVSLKFAFCSVLQFEVCSVLRFKVCIVPRAAPDDEIMAFIVHVNCQLASITVFRITKFVLALVAIWQ